MKNEKIPDFVRDGAFNWLVKGYHYELKKEELLRAEQENNENPWYSIAYVVELAKCGDFSRAHSLSKYFDYDLTTNAAPAAMLITGDIGRVDDLKKLIEIMLNGSDGFRVYACRAAANSGCMWMIPHMLEAWHSAESIDAHENIGYSIADLLDSIECLDDLGSVASRVGTYTNEAGQDLFNPKLKQLADKIRDKKANSIFHETVMKKYSDLKKTYKSDQMIIWAGEQKSICEFSQFFLKLIVSNRFNMTLSPLVVPLRQKFEASTGIDCSVFFENGRFRQIAAVGVLENFLSGVEAKKYKKGNRYFFGNIID